MKRRAFLIRTGRILFGCSLLPQVGCLRGSQEPPALKTGDPLAPLIGDLEKQVIKLLADARTPGASIAIVRDGRLFWRRGFGVKDAASQRPVDSATVFEAASMSKPVFAYLVMKLCEKGVLDLDTPLTKYTTERLIDDPRLELITARHVLSHTSGFQEWRSDREPLSIHFQPGEKWLYSGEGYFYLQSVITRLTGRVDEKDCAIFEGGLRVCATDISQYLDRNILRPFGMTNSSYAWDGGIKTRAAAPHDQEGKPMPERKPLATTAARYAAAGGLYTTPTDYLKFVLEVIDPKPSDSSRLGKSSLAEMLRAQVTINDQMSWGLGWQIVQTAAGTFISHDGSNPGFKCYAAASVQRKSAYVIMTNGENGGEVISALVSSGVMRRFLVS